MKKSHRKDVIIARVIFGIICAILLAILVTLVSLIIRVTSDQKKQEQQQQQQQQSESEFDPNQVFVPNSETETETEPEEEYRWIEAQDGLKLRAESTSTGEILEVIPYHEKVTYLGDDISGWIKVEYKGKEGYVAEQYVTDEDPTGSSTDDE